MMTQFSDTVEFHYDDRIQYLHNMAYNTAVTKAMDHESVFEQK